MDSQPTLLAADLFSGAGGLSEGLRDSGFCLVAGADSDPDACATYRRNFPQTTVIEGDLTDRRIRAAVKAAAGVDGRLDLLAGGPPCQAFSQVRNHDRLIEDPRNGLYREFVHLLDELRPRALLVENVLGLQQLGRGALQEEISEDLCLGGDYEVFAVALDAGNFGVPQRRPRLFFIGVERSLKLPTLTLGTGVTESVRLRRIQTGVGPRYRLRCSDPHHQTMLLDPDDLRAVTASQALSDLAEPGEAYSSEPKSAYQEQMREGSERPHDHIPSRIRDDTVRRLKAIPAGGNVYDLPPSLSRRYLDSSRWGPSGNGERLSRRHYYAYRRLHPNALAWTSNTKADFAYHYRRIRGLSVREAARLQSFPDRFHFVTAPPGTPGQLKNGARHSRYRQVGNAVPPLLAAAIGRAIVKSLAWESEAAPGLTKIAA